MYSCKHCHWNRQSTTLWVYVYHAVVGDDSGAHACRGRCVCGFVFVNMYVIVSVCVCVCVCGFACGCVCVHVCLVGFLNTHSMSPHHHHTNPQQKSNAGLLSSVHAVSGDACLYTESYLHTRLSTIDNTTTRQRAVLGLEYYTGTRNLSDQQLLQQVYGINASTWTGVLLTAQPLLRWLNSTEGQTTIESLPLSPEDKAVVLAVPLTVNATFDGIARFIQQVQREEWNGVYHDAKRLVCCDVRGAAYMLWIAWTAAGGGCLVLAALLSYRGTRLLVWDV